MRKRQVFHGVADSFGKLAHLLLGPERRQHDELLATITADGGAMADDGVLQGVAHGHQTPVAFLVAITVIVFLEEVDIDEENGKTFLLLAPIVPQQAQMMIDGPAVLQSGQESVFESRSSACPRSSAAFCWALASSALRNTWYRSRFRFQFT